MQIDFSIAHFPLLRCDDWRFSIFIYSLIYLLLWQTALDFYIELTWTYTTCWTCELHHRVRNLDELVAPFLFLSLDISFVIQHAFCFWVDCWFFFYFSSAIVPSNVEDKLPFTLVPQVRIWTEKVYQFWRVYHNENFL